MFNDHCVKNGDVRMSCCYAVIMTTDKLFFCAVSPVRPTLLPFRFGPLVDSSTSRFAREGTESDRDLLGSGSPSVGLKNRRRTVSTAQVNSVLYSLHTAMDNIDYVYVVYDAADRKNYPL